MEDLKQQAIEQEKQQLKNAAKEAAKKVGQQIWSAITPYLSYIIAAMLLIIIIIGCFDWGSIEASAQDMHSASNASWSQFLEYVAIKEGGTTVNGGYYIVEDDSDGNPTVGHGLCLKSYADNPSGSYLHVEEFAAYGLDSKKLADDYESGKTATVSVEIADAIWESHLKTIFDSITTQYPNLTTYQRYALTDVKYRRGNINGFDKQYSSKWKNSDDEYNNYVEANEKFSTDTLFSFFWNGGHDLDGVKTRKKDQWVLFKYGYYRPLSEYFIAAPSAADISSLATKDYKGTYQSLTGGFTFVEYYQNGASWSSDKLNGGSSSSVTIGNSGCHVTSMAIALTAVTGDTITPKYVNNAFNFMANGDEAILNTTKFSYLKDSVKIGGLITSGLNKNFLVSNLNAGNILMLRFQGSCEWTSSTHYVIGADYKKENGQDYIYIVNPNRYGPNGWVRISKITIGQWTQARIISQK